MTWFEVIILAAIIIDIISKFISVKECQDILERCKACVRSCGIISSDVSQARIYIYKSVADVNLMKDDCKDQLKASEAAVKGLAKDQYDIWEIVHSISAAVDSLNKRLTNPRDLEPDWKPAEEEDVLFTDTEDEGIDI